MPIRSESFQNTFECSVSSWGSSGEINKTQDSTNAKKLRKLLDTLSFMWLLYSLYPIFDNIYLIHQARIIKLNIAILRVGILIIFNSLICFNMFCFPMKWNVSMYMMYFSTGQTLLVDGPFIHRESESHSTS